MSLGQTDNDAPHWSAVLLDRDGVINRELGRAVLSADEFEFLPGVLDALRRLVALSVPIVVVSNQSAIGRGWVARAVVDAIHRDMLDAVRAAGGRVDGVVICPHAPGDGCGCRKPLPGLLRAAAETYQFDLRRAVVIGDSHRDIQAAQAAGAVPLMVRSGHALAPELEALLDREQVRVVADLAEAAELLEDGPVFLTTRGKREDR